MAAANRAILLSRLTFEQECSGNASEVGGENREGKEGLPDGGVPHLLPAEAASLVYAICCIEAAGPWVSHCPSFSSHCLSIKWH